MVPPDQSLDADDLLPTQMQLGLIMQEQFVARDRVVKLAADLPITFRRRGYRCGCATRVGKRAFVRIAALHRAVRTLPDA